MHLRVLRPREQGVERFGDVVKPMNWRIALLKRVNGAIKGGAFYARWLRWMG